MIDRLIKVLKGLDPELTPVEVADMLWLASHFGATEPVDGGDESFLESPDEPAPEEKKPTFEIIEDPLPPKPPWEIYLPPRSTASKRHSGKRGFASRVPAAPALPNERDLARALRPLKRRVYSRTQWVIDEEETAHYSAQVKAWIPRLRPALSRWLDVVVVVDEWSSMVIWERTIEEFKRLLERLGAFRNIQMWGVSTDAESGTLRLHSGTGYGARSKRSRSPKELLDPRGERLVLVVSDCLSPAWHNGEFTKLVATWSQKNFVALVQVLPSRLWQGTALGQAYRVFLRVPGLAIPNTRLVAERERDWIDDTIPPGVKMPVITLQPKSLGMLAQAVTGTQELWIPGFILPTTPRAEREKRALPAQRPTAFSSSSQVSNSEQQVQLFRNVASPPAQRLAGFLAATPLSLPVMRLVQRVMLPESQQVHLAEVFLSGLITRSPSKNGSLHPDKVQYDFVGDARNRLLSTTPVGETLDVLETVSDYVNRKAGHPLDFDAILSGDSPK